VASPPAPRRQLALKVAVALVALALAGVGGFLASRGGSSQAAPAPAPAPSRCPLTGQPAPPGGVPARPALGVKVDNLPAARPQAGLDRADIVYEEPVEGGLTRFLAVFQCSDARVVEPVRSARLVDPDLLSQFGRPLFAYSGGIAPVVDKVRSSPLFDVSFNRAPSAYSKDPRRAAPHNLAASTAALWAAGARQGAPAQAPAPVFTYGSPSGGRPASQLRIAFPGASAVQWTWSPSSSAWLRSYYLGGGPALLSDGSQVAAANVVVEKVVLTPSPYVEDATGAHENLVGLTGSGPLTVLSAGTAVEGTWSRPSLSDPTRLLGPGGTPIALSPGPTWVELVPSDVAVTSS